jgi:hypothetical protein
MQDVAVKRVNDHAAATPPVSRIEQKRRDAAQRARFGRMRMDDVRLFAEYQCEQTSKRSKIGKRMQSARKARKL